MKIYRVTSWGCLPSVGLQLLLMFPKYGSDFDGTLLKDFRVSLRWSDCITVRSNTRCGRKWSASWHLPPAALLCVPYMSPMLAYSLIWLYNFYYLFPDFERSSLPFPVQHSSFPQCLASSISFSAKSSWMALYPFRQNWVLPFIVLLLYSVHILLGEINNCMAVAP